MTEHEMIAALRRSGYSVSRRLARTANPKGRSHRRCAEHVRVDGYQKPVCILRDQERGPVLQFAYEMLGIAQEHRMWGASLAA